MSGRLEALEAEINRQVDAGAGVHETEEWLQAASQAAYDQRNSEPKYELRCGMPGHAKGRPVVGFVFQTPGGEVFAPGGKADKPTGRVTFYALGAALGLSSAARSGSGSPFGPIHLQTFAITVRCQMHGTFMIAAFDPDAIPDLTIPDRDLRPAVSAAAKLRRSVVLVRPAR